MNPLSSDPLRQAEQAIHDGKINEARAMLIDYIKRDPNYDRAWWLLAFTLTDLNQQVDCLKRVLNLNPGHVQAREWLAKLKKTGSLPPLKPAVNPFVSGNTGALTGEPVPPPTFRPTPAEKPAPPSASMWPAPERKPVPVAEPPVVPSWQAPSAAPASPPPPSDTVPPAWLMPEEEKPEPPTPSRVKQPVQGPPANGKKSKKKNTWIVDFIIVSVVLCLAVTVGGIYWLSQQTKFAVQELQQTAQAAQAQIIAPTRTPIPTWTTTSTHTTIPSKTPTETPSLTPTLEFTYTPTAIPTNQIGPVVGLFPPDFTLTNALTGEQITLSDYRGEAVLIFFWATWCPYCKAEIPDLQELYAQYAEEGLVVLAVDSGETSSTVAGFGSASGLSFPLLVDADQTVTAAYKVDTLPRHIFISRYGRISLIEFGAMDRGELEWQIKVLLHQFPTPTP